MKNKKIIGIDINEILRARWLQFDRYYAEEYGEEGIPKIPYVANFFEEYVWEDFEDDMEVLVDNAPEDISELDYIKEEEEDKSKAEDLLFKTEHITMTAREVYNKFMYETFCYEIFGAAPKMYKRVDYDLDLFYKKFKDQFDFVIVSKENWFSIAPTLFFLSKITSRIKKYALVESNQEIWDEVDFLITTDPELLKSPKGKSSIKLERPFNEELKGDFPSAVINFIDLIKNEEFIEMIGYKTEHAISQESNGVTNTNTPDNNKENK